jgi:hypothetical protein
MAYPEAKEVNAAGISWEMPLPKGYNVLRVEDIMV